MTMPTELYRELPSVDELLHAPATAALVNQEGQAAVADACRSVLSRLRQEISEGHLDSHKLQVALTNIDVAVGEELARASLLEGVA